jgi:TetR/AcrR family tetracycline transcriptional repressor
MPLQRDIVVRTALDLLEEVGLDGLTVRRLAQQLNVQNPALYWHFKNKQELLDSMAEEMLTSVIPQLSPRKPAENWAEWFKAFGRLLYSMMLAHRDGARIMVEADMTRSSLFFIYDQALQVLLEAGFGSQESIYNVLSLVNYTLGAAYLEQGDPHYLENKAPNPPPKLNHSVLNAAELPALSAILNEGNIKFELNSATFEAGLNLLVSGMQNSLKPAIITR